jgi:hypothetical protein
MLHCRAADRERGPGLLSEVPSWSMPMLMLKAASRSWPATLPLGSSRPNRYWWTRPKPAMSVAAMDAISTVAPGWGASIMSPLPRYMPT